MTKKLLIIIPDKLSSLLEKGEIVPRYYNPGNLFDEVHIMMTNDDKPDPSHVQPMVGKAKLFLHNLPTPPRFFIKTLGWQSFLMKDWLELSLKKIRKIAPSVIRCYGMHLNLKIASHYKKIYGTPLLVSLHTHPYLDSHKETRSLKEKVIKWCELQLSKNLSDADIIIPVYRGILDFLSPLRIKKCEVAYNTVNISKTNHIKKDWNHKNPFKIICIGQQIPNKNPENLIKAVAQLDNVSLAVIGKGPLNKSLKKLVYLLRAENKIHFIDSIPSINLCANLKNYDCFSASIDCIGLSKTLIESFLVGLPVLINLNSHVQVPELDDSICKRVPDTVEGYILGLKDLINSYDLRKSLAKRASRIAWQYWDPKVTEQHHKKLYERYIAQ